MSEITALAPVLAAARATGLRVQGTVPTPGAAHRVVVHRHRTEHPGRFTGYERVEIEAAPDDVVDAGPVRCRAGP